MTKSIKTYLLAASCICFSCMLKAQSFEIGPLLGGSNYQGDLADGIVVLKETRPAYGVIMRYTPLKFLSFRLGFVQAGIVGDDANSTNIDIRKRGYKISANMSELSILTEWQLPSYGTSGQGIFKQSITPFVFAGVGFASRDRDPTGPDNSSGYSPFPEFDSKKSFISIPIGGGVKYNFAPNFSTSLEWGLRATFSDYVDGVSQNANPLKNDYYMIGGLSFTYILNGGGDNPFGRMKN
jgi:OmpA-OmpF porin, OOP family